MEIVNDYVFEQITNWVISEYKMLGFTNYISELEDYYEFNLGILLVEKTNEEKIKIIKQISESKRREKEDIAEDLMNECVRMLLKKEDEDIVYLFFSLMESGGECDKRT